MCVCVCMCGCCCCCCCYARQFHFHLVPAMWILWPCIGRLLVSRSWCLLYAHPQHNAIMIYGNCMLLDRSSQFLHLILALCRITTSVRPFVRSGKRTFAIYSLFLPDVEKLPLTCILCKGLNCLPLYFPRLLLSPVCLFSIVDFIADDPYKNKCCAHR